MPFMIIIIQYYVVCFIPIIFVLACNKHFCLSHNEVIGWVYTLSHLLVICHLLHHLCLCSPSIHCFRHLSPFVIYIIYRLLLCEIVVTILLTHIFVFIVAVLFLLSHYMLIFSLHNIYSSFLCFLVFLHCCCCCCFYCCYCCCCWS